MPYQPKRGKTMTTIKQFIKRHHITARAKYVDSNPNMPDFKGDHWKVTLTMNGHQMTVPFSKGYGHHSAEPTADEVLECLAQDSFSIDQPFEVWAEGLGYDTDSRNAERIYRTCQTQTNKLRRLLGDHFDELMECEA